MYCLGKSSEQFESKIASHFSFVSYTTTWCVCLCQVPSTTHVWAGTLMNNLGTDGCAAVVYKMVPGMCICILAPQRGLCKPVGGRRRVCRAAHHSKHRL